MSQVSPEARAYLRKQAADSEKREHILPCVRLLMDVLEAQCKGGVAVQKWNELNVLLGVSGFELRKKV